MNKFLKFFFFAFAVIGYALLFYTTILIDNPYMALSLFTLLIAIGSGFIGYSIFRIRNQWYGEIIIALKNPEKILNELGKHGPIYEDGKELEFSLIENAKGKKELTLTRKDIPRLIKKVGDIHPGKSESNKKPKSDFFSKALKGGYYGKGR